MCFTLGAEARALASGAPALYGLLFVCMRTPFACLVSWNIGRSRVRRRSKRSLQSPLLLNLTHAQVHTHVTCLQHPWHKPWAGGKPSWVRKPGRWRSAVAGALPCAVYRLSTGVHLLDPAAAADQANATARAQAAARAGACAGACTSGCGLVQWVRPGARMCASDKMPSACHDVASRCWGCSRPGAWGAQALPHTHPALHGVPGLCWAHARPGAWKGAAMSCCASADWSQADIDAQAVLVWALCGLEFACTQESSLCTGMCMSEMAGCPCCWQPFRMWSLLTSACLPPRPHAGRPAAVDKMC